jgi:hypothetical protein
LLGKKSARHDKATALRRKQKQLDENAIQILKELANGRFLLRTRTSVANETGIEKPEVDRIMPQLARKDWWETEW